MVCGLKQLIPEWAGGERCARGCAETRFIETAFGGVARSRLHEWTGIDEPPLAVLGHVAQRALGSGLIVWVGRAVWPYPSGLTDAALSRSVLVDVRDDAARLWATDLAMRSDGVDAVVADGRGMDLRATRRLQLACERSDAVGLLARGADEARTPSAAAYRWRVACAEHEAGRFPGPCWWVELVRCKDASGVVRAGRHGERRKVAWRHDEGLVAVAPLVADRAADAARSA